MFERSKVENQILKELRKLFLLLKICDPWSIDALKMWCGCSLLAMEKVQEKLAI